MPSLRSLASPRLSARPVFSLRLVGLLAAAMLLAMLAFSQIVGSGGAATRQLGNQARQGDATRSAALAADWAECSAMSRACTSWP